MSTPVYPTPFVIQPPVDLLQQQPQLRQLSQALARAYANNHFVSDAALQQVGQVLWQTLAQHADFTAAFDQARQLAGAQTLPLLIDSAEPALQQLPWETLHHPTFGFLGKANGFTLARRHAPAPVTVAPEPGPLRVLIFTTLPDDLTETSRLDVEEEQAQLLEALTPWVLAGLVLLEMPDDGRFSTLQSLLQKFQPHLLFFSGHGQFVQPPFRDAPPYATLLFESETGGSDVIHEDQIAQTLLGSSVQGIVLSACESAMTASEQLTNGLVWRLSALGIPHVIGMRESVLDRAGTLFARAFCDAVARRERIDVAMQWGRQAIATPLTPLITPPLSVATPSPGGGGKLPPPGEGRGGVRAEISLGQWCLPLLLTRDPAQPLVDWHFTPQRPETPLLNQTLQTITLPPRFIGRRAELRRLQSRWRQGQLRQLLITGPGGQGKTALAGKLAQDLQKRGYQVLAWSARPGGEWTDFLFELELQLNQTNAERYSRMVKDASDEAKRATVLLRLLLQQFGNRLLLFFDNLESVQDPQTHALTDGSSASPTGSRLAAWMAAAQLLTGQGLILLLTSRWQLPGWPDGDHLPLVHANYGDFLQMARAQLSLAFFQDRDRLRRLYRTLHGNGRGLTFFAAAIQPLNAQEESAFLQALAQAATETQTDMALAQIVQHLPTQAVTLLHRLPVYQTPVPQEGIGKVALDLPEPTALLQALTAVALVEEAYAADLQTTEYQLSPLVVEWLRQQGVPLPERAFYQRAAAYQLYLYEQERPTLTQAIVAHGALQLAGETEKADRLALERVVGRLNRAGLYRTLLDDWLPAICQSPNPQIRSEALGQTGKQHHHLGNFATALPFFAESLKICQEIGDKAGEGTTLNNLATLAHAQGDYATALKYLEQSLNIQREIGDKAGEGATLNNLSQIFKAQGDYATALKYLEQSLKIRQEIGDKAGEGATLNNLSQIYDAQGEYATALKYLEQSLKIQREIGDVAGLCPTLFNMGHIYLQNGQQREAVEAWVTVYQIANRLQLAQALAALEGLANSLGLEGGLAGWAALAQRLGQQG